MVFRTVTNKSMEEFDRNVSGEDSTGSMAKFSFLNIQISKLLCFFFFLERDEVCSSVRRPLHCSPPSYRTFRHQLTHSSPKERYHTSHAASPIDRVALLATLTIKTFNVQGVAEIIEDGTYVWHCTVRL